MEYSIQQKRPLLIFAEDIDSGVLQTLVINKLKGNMQVCAVKSPGFGDNRTNTMGDMAVALGATFIAEEGGITIESSNPEDVFGTAKKVVITKDAALFQVGDKTDAVKERIELIQA